MTRGFITIATGKELYYQLAQNLLKSYRLYSRNPMPFAILCDRENTYTEQFDQTVILEHPLNSFWDKFVTYMLKSCIATIGLLDISMLMLFSNLHFLEFKSQKERVKFSSFKFSAFFRFLFAKNTKARVSKKIAKITIFLRILLVALFYICKQNRHILPVIKEEF